MKKNEKGRKENKWGRGNKQKEIKIKREGKYDKKEKNKTGKKDRGKLMSRS